MVVHMIYWGSNPGILTYPRPWGVELISKHASEELKASSEVPCVLLGLVLRFSLGSWFLHRFQSEDHARP